MDRREIEEAIEREITHWPGLSVEFVMGGKHPKAKLAYKDLVMSVVYPGSPGDARNTIRQTLGDVRRAARKLEAVRDKPEPTAEEDEAPYRKPNDGADKRPDPPRELATPEPTIADKVKAAGIPVREVVYVPDDDETDDDAAREARLAELQTAIDAIVDGIYFDLPDEIYHGVRALGSGSLNQLLISPATFWRGSWLDPNRPELDEEATNAQILGKAYHCARLEPDSFDSRYVRALDKRDYPKKGLLTSDTAVKTALKELGQQQTFTGETTLERAQRLADLGYDGTIWAIEQAKWEAERNGRIGLPAQYYDDILLDMQRIAGVPEIHSLLSGGAAEVSVFWRDEEGLRCKARFDYLRADGWVDFKTYANPAGKHVNQAITDAFRYNRYYVQAAHYKHGLEAIRAGNLPIVGEPSDHHRELINQLMASTAPPVCHYVFQEKGGVPNLFAKRFRFSAVDAYRAGEIEIMLADKNPTVREMAREAMGQKTAIAKKAEYEIRIAKETFLTYSQVYEPGEPWAPLDPMGTIDDADFNPRWLEGES